MHLTLEEIAELLSHHSRTQHLAPGGYVMEPGQMPPRGPWGQPHSGGVAPQRQGQGEPTAPMAPNIPAPPTYAGAGGTGSGANTGASGTTLSGAGQNPYSSGIPLSNTFVAKTPTSNMDFGAGQYAPQLGQSAASIGRLTGSLEAQANGGGPNLAAQQERQATDRNIAQQFAMAQAHSGDAGALRSIAANTGAMNQQAAADSATQRMQQQLAAQNQLGQLGLGMYGTAGRLMTDAQKMQLQQAQGNQQAFLNAQGINAQTSAGNQQYGANVIGSGINAGAQALAAGATALGNGLGKSGNDYINNPNINVDSSPMPSGTPTVDGAPVGGGGEAPQDTSYYARGGLVGHYDDGGEVPPGYGPMAPNALPANFTDYSGKSEVGDSKLDLSRSTQLNPYRAVDFSKSGPQQTGVSKAVGNVTGAVVGGIAHSNPITGGIYDIGKSLFGDSGGQVPGEAEVAGNSPKNDKVPAMLSPGEVVVPREVVGDREKELAFLDEVEKGKGPKPTFKDVLVSHRNMTERVKKLEAFCMGGQA